MIDWSKLTPAPWEVLTDKDSQTLFIPRPNGFPMLLEEDNDPVPLEFAALARNAFDVLTRRGWPVSRCPTGEWKVDVPTRGGASWECRAGDPFAALIEADRWYRENVE